MRRDLILLIAGTLASFPLGLVVGLPWLLPVLNAVPAYVLLVHRLRKGERGGAVRAAIWWAGVLALTGTLCLSLWPSAAEEVALGRPEGFLGWIDDGREAESSPPLFLPRQLAQLAAFAALGLATAGSLSTVMGAVLVNDVSFYAAGLLRDDIPAWAVLPLGWPPWTFARMAALCILGVVLAEPLVHRLFPTARQNLKVVGRAPYYVAALTGLLVAWVLQAALTPVWAGWLRALQG